MPNRLTDRISTTQQVLKVIKAPVADHDVANKKYVDSYVDSQVSIVPSTIFSTPNDVTHSRDFNTTYQNTNTKPIFVLINCMVSVENTGTELNGQSLFCPVCDANSTPTTELGWVGISQIYFKHLTSDTYLLRDVRAVSFIVPPDYYYKLKYTTDNSGKTPVLYAWIEYV